MVIAKRAEATLRIKCDQTGGDLPHFPAFPCDEGDEKKDDKDHETDFRDQGSRTGDRTETGRIAWLIAEARPEDADA